MKNLFACIFGIASSAAAFAQDSQPKNPSPPQLSLHSGSGQSLNDINPAAELLPVLAIGLIVILTTQVTKYILAFRLKNKIIDRGISEQLANSILEKSVADKKDDTIKWVFLLLGLSGGLAITYYTRPLHIHSLAILAFSLGISFLSYYFFLLYSKK